MTNELAKITPMDMLQTAVDKGADLDQMQKLMDLHERWEENQAKKAYVTAMSEFQKKAPIIHKTREGHNTKYAGLAETIMHIRGLMQECGLSHTWKTNQTNGEVTVTCCVTHVDGHSECTQLSAGADTSGNKNNVQAIGSTVTYLQRYTLFAILGLSSSEDDFDGITPVETITENQVDFIADLVEETASDMKMLLISYGINDIAELPAEKFNALVGQLNRKKGGAK